MTNKEITRKLTERVIAGRKAIIQAAADRGWTEGSGPPEPSETGLYLLNEDVSIIAGEGSWASLDVGTGCCHEDEMKAMSKAIAEHLPENTASSIQFSPHHTSGEFGDFWAGSMVIVCLDIIPPDSYRTTNIHLQVTDPINA